MATTMAMAGGCVGVVNAGGVTANNVIGRGFVAENLSERDLPRERLFQKSGNAIARANDTRMQ